jgi:hypothetical protein
MTGTSICESDGESLAQRRCERTSRMCAPSSPRRSQVGLFDRPDLKDDRRSQWNVRRLPSAQKM